MAHLIKYNKDHISFEVELIVGGTKTFTLDGFNEIFFKT